MLELWRSTPDAGSDDLEISAPQVAPLAYSVPSLAEERRLLRRNISKVVVLVSVASVALGLGWRAARNWSDWREQSRLAVILEPPETITYDPSAGTSKVVFSHEMRRPDGALRLVLIDGMPGDNKSFLLARVVPFISLFDSASVQPATSSTYLEFTKLYAGQPDRADASHCTVGYELSHGKGTIDCWLQNDDTVKFEVRDGPLAGQ